MKPYDSIWKHPFQNDDIYHVVRKRNRLFFHFRKSGNFYAKILLNIYHMLKFL